MKTNSTFTIEDRLSLDRLKRTRLPLAVGTGMKRDLPQESTEELVPVKDLIANLLVPEKDAGADFERAFVKRSAERFAEWVNKELEK
jgi:hypothetical protein